MLSLLKLEKLGVLQSPCAVLEHCPANEFSLPSAPCQPPELWHRHLVTFEEQRWDGRRSTFCYG